MNAKKFLMYVVMAHVWTKKEVITASVIMVLRHPMIRLCVWVCKQSTIHVLEEHFWD